MKQKNKLGLKELKKKTCKVKENDKGFKIKSLMKEGKAYEKYQ